MPEKFYKSQLFQIVCENFIYYKGFIATKFKNFGDENGEEKS